jgi:hypothetical protein
MRQAGASRRRLRVTPAGGEGLVLRRDASLEAALRRVEAEGPGTAVRIVVNRAWWDALSEAERTGYRRRCEAVGMELGADDRISRHFVEVIGSEEPPLSSERRT